MGYLHVEIITEQLSKKVDKPCGDVTETERDKTSTIHFLCDGVGSGIKANIPATMAAARLKEMLRNGFTLRKSFSSLVSTMEDARKNDKPCAFFSAARILNDGIATILTYEMPGVIFISNGYAAPLKSIPQTGFEGIVSESNCSLKIGEGILLVSDGITQAGMGKGITNGWGIDGLNKFINKELRAGTKIKELPKQILNEAKRLWQYVPADDLTVSLLFCRKGRVVNLLTGPPENSENDAQVINHFLRTDGLKIICGATTAKIAARVLKTELSIEQEYGGFITPPNYEIDGIDLVTEGAITLNQLYNVWGEDFKKLDKNNPVTVLVALLNIADRINFFIGKAKNPAEGDISFKQIGILTREKILPLIIEKFRADGKLVDVEEF